MKRQGWLEVYDRSEGWERIYRREPRREEYADLPLLDAMKLAESESYELDWRELQCGA